MKLPFVNGRAVSWLHQVEESIAGSDGKSQNSFNMQPLNTIENKLGNQFSSMASISSQGSSKSNNENVDMRQREGSSSNRNSKHMRDSNGQIYDTLQSNRKSSKQRHSAVLK